MITKSKTEVTSNFLKSPFPKKESLTVKQKKSKVPFITSGIVFLLVIGLSAGVFLGGLFNVKNYDTKGNIVVAKKDIEDEAKKIADNKLIFTVDPTQLENDLLNKFTLLSYVRVTKSLPATLTIEVRERTKSAVIQTLENIVLVSQDGKVLQEISSDQVQNGMVDGMFVVKMLDEPKKSVGDTFDPNFIGLISQLLSSWKQNNAPEYSTIIIDKQKDTKIVLNSGTTVIISLSDSNLDVSKLVSEMTSVYNRLSSGKKIKTLDMRNDTKIAVTYF